MPKRKVAEMGQWARPSRLRFGVFPRGYQKFDFKCLLCHNCVLFSSSLHYLNRSHSECECSIGTRKCYASDSHNLGESDSPYNKSVLALQTQVSCTIVQVRLFGLLS